MLRCDKTYNLLWIVDVPNLSPNYSFVVHIIILLGTVLCVLLGPIRIPILNTYQKVIKQIIEGY